MKAFGIDPGLTTTGYGIIEKTSNEYKLIGYGTIKPDKEIRLEEKLYYIHKELKSKLKEYKPTTVAMEELYFARNRSSGIKVSHARGVLMLACFECGYSVYEYGPKELKLGISGYGDAPKAQVMGMVQKLLRLEELIKPADASDALALAIYHLNVIKDGDIRR